MGTYVLMLIVLGAGGLEVPVYMGNYANEVACKSAGNQAVNKIAPAKPDKPVRFVCLPTS